MKTLNNHVILFDNECPMCYVYTKAFVKTGMLPNNGREAYQNMPAEICPLVNQQRAANEIALINTETGEVTYGIYSLFKIIGNAMPVFRTLFNFVPFIWLMTKVYAFVSYNRKVIIPAAIKENILQPTFRLNYRIAYLIFSWLVTAYILTAYAHLLVRFVPVGGASREYLICAGQIFFQAAIVSFYKKEKLWDYLGNMMTVSLAGGLLLLPGLIIHETLNINPAFYLLYFLFFAAVMLSEHIRRSRILKLGWLMSITWVIYRLIVLGLILIF